LLTDVHGSTVAVALVGELDMAEADAFEEELRRLEETWPELLVVDLSELTLIDSHGLSALMQADARARAEQRRLVLVPAPDAVMQVFRITLLDRRFAWVDAGETGSAEAAALERLRAARGSIRRSMVDR
jgi:anti-sigma B factor antagonist